MKKNNNKKLLGVLPAFVIALSTLLLGSFLIYKLSSPQLPESIQSGLLSPDQDILITTRSGPVIHVGEPFEYQISVLYRPDKIVPDFRRLLRDVSFAPFEQRHKSRTQIIEVKNNEDVYQYTLSYLIVGIDVMPGNTYTFDEILLGYTDILSSESRVVSVRPTPIIIDRYYTGNPLDMPLKSIKGEVDNNATIILFLLIFCLILFLALAAALITSVIRRRDMNPQSLADKLRGRFYDIQSSVRDRRDKLIEYEKLVLSLFKFYGNRTAMGFWTSSVITEDTIWSSSSIAIKHSLESAYQHTAPEEPDIARIEAVFDSIYVEIESQALNERLAIERETQGTIGRRVKKNIFTMIAGMMAAVIGLIFLYLIMSQDLWVNQDAMVFNKWLASLPERLIVEEKQHELNNLDIEMLGHISDEQRVLENLQSDTLRSAYLYNYATLATNIYKSILLNPPQDEEEEASEPPTFEFPLHLMANAARFYPDDEDVRRNLEVIIGLKDSQKKEESGEVQGELGPPTPGFSRDMNPLLF